MLFQHWADFFLLVFFVSFGSQKIILLKTNKKNVLGDIVSTKKCYKVKLNEKESKSIPPTFNVTVIPFQNLCKQLQVVLSPSLPCGN